MNSPIEFIEEFKSEIFLAFVIPCYAIIEFLLC